MKSHVLHTVSVVFLLRQQGKFDMITLRSERDNTIPRWVYVILNISKWRERRGENGSWHFVRSLLTRANGLEWPRYLLWPCRQLAVWILAETRWAAPMRELHWSRSPLLYPQPTERRLMVAGSCTLLQILRPLNLPTTAFLGPFALMVLNRATNAPEPAL